jgi:hypothetical protein
MKSKTNRSRNQKRNYKKSKRNQKQKGGGGKDKKCEKLNEKSKASYQKQHGQPAPHDSYVPYSKYLHWGERFEKLTHHLNGKIGDLKPQIDKMQADVDLFNSHIKTLDSWKKNDCIDIMKYNDMVSGLCSKFPGIDFRFVMDTQNGKREDSFATTGHIVDQLRCDGANMAKPNKDSVQTIDNGAPLGSMMKPGRSAPPPPLPSNPPPQLKSRNNRNNRRNSKRNNRNNAASLQSFRTATVPLGAGTAV